METSSLRIQKWLLRLSQLLDGEKFQTGLRAGDTPAGSGTPPASFSMGLCLGRTLGSGLDSVTTRTQRLEIVDAVNSFGEGNDVVHQDGSCKPPQNRRSAGIMALLPAPCYGCVASACRSRVCARWGACRAVVPPASPTA